ncbi:ABC transporter substrate-binding protein [Alicyclobacillus sp.]|uniref:ABC transporter substrate-binding protein n=1 Tax=Alicyclobacillus sp. TaxID=61169 RepID=UPI0025C4E6F8|nr:ABC transporter substrate-binding protein [Alicyclobacillus sp.]MCL6518040.1 ABC transporter substrate-binding protein [Alicyclobacillus sp.]
MKARWLAAGASVVLGTTLVAGCGGGQTAGNTANTAGNAVGAAPAGPVTITFYEAMPGALGDELKKLTDAFQKQNPNIKVDLVYSGSYTTQKQKLTAAIAAHKPPTIAQVQETWETEYYNSGLLQPVQDLLPKETIDDLIPIWRDDNSYDGKLVSVPFNKSAYVLFYNPDDFAKAGITTPPATWDELEQDAIKITKATGIPGLAFQGNYYTFEMLLHQAGGKVLTDDQKQAAFGDAAGKKALTFMRKLVLDDKAATAIGGNAYLSDGFNTHKYAMDLDSTASMSFIKNVKFKVAPLPGDVQKAVPTAGTNIVLFKDATPEQQQAAAKYLNFLISKDNTIEWAKATGYLPVRKSALDDPAWKEIVSQNPNLGVAPAELDNAYFSPRLAELYSGQNNVTTQIGNMLSGKQSVDDTLKKSVDAINQALAGK